MTVMQEDLLPMNWASHQYIALHAYGLYMAAARSGQLIEICCAARYNDFLFKELHKFRFLIASIMVVDPFVYCGVVMRSLELPQLLPKIPLS